METFDQKLARHGVESSFEVNQELKASTNSHRCVTLRNYVGGSTVLGVLKFSRLHAMCGHSVDGVTSALVVDVGPLGVLTKFFVGMVTKDSCKEGHDAFCKGFLARGLRFSGTSVGLLGFVSHTIQPTVLPGRWNERRGLPPPDLKVGKHMLGPFVCKWCK